MAGEAKIVTRALPFTKAALRRAADVAREKGFRVLIRPDGTMVLEVDPQIHPQSTDPPLEPGGEVVL